MTGRGRNDGTSFAMAGPGGAVTRKRASAVPILPLHELRARLARGQRLLGLDIGAKTVGLALSDATLTVATPLQTLRRTRFTHDLELLRGIAAEHDVGGLVLGLPVNMDGSEGRACQSVRNFAGELLRRWEVPLAFWDERLSTAAVTRTLLEADLSRRRRAEVVDKLAAAYILQGALDAMAHQASPT